MDSYDRILEFVKSQLRRSDPAGLIALGAPSEDEYNTEAELIAAQALKCSTAEELARDMRRIFVAYIGEDRAGSEALHVQMAKAIYDQLRQEGGD